MSENLSIDEIIAEAQRVQNEIKKKASVIKENVAESARSPEKSESDVKAYNQSSAASQKTMPVELSRSASEDDQKTKPVRVSEKTSPVPDTKRFFKTASKDSVYDSTPPDIIEKPATIKSKSRFDKTSDLQEIPTILAIEELHNTRIMGNIERKEKAEDNSSIQSGDYTQIKLEGFDDELEDVPKIDEEEAEKLLRERRKEKVGKFRIFAPDTLHDGIDSENSEPIDDYERKEEKSAVTEELRSLWKKAVIQSAVTGGLTILLLILSVLESTGKLWTFLSEQSVYAITVSVIFAIVMAVNFRVFKSAFSALFKKKINFDFSCASASIIVLIHCILLVFIPDLTVEGGTPYALSASFALLMNALGRQALANRIANNFDFITDGRDKYTVENIGNPIDATIISRGLLMGEPILKNSVKTDLPTNFLEISYMNEPADKISSKISTIMLALSAVLFGVVFAVSRNVYAGFNAAVCALCISLPVCALFATNTALLGSGRALAQKGGAVCGYAGAQSAEDANAMVIEASDLFGRNSCDLHGIKTFNGTKIDDAIIQTAAVIIKTKSPLANVFDDVIVGKQTILPDAQGIVYEDRMGTSAWIYKKKILVGNRNLLINHGVSVPKIEYENKYTRKGRKALYLAVAGKIAAMFIVSYSADEELKRELRRLEKTGITIIVKSCDPYINEESLNELFELPEGYMRVMNAASGRVYSKYSDLSVATSPAYIVHNGTALGFVSAMKSADSLMSVSRLISVLVSFGSAVGFGIAALLSLLGGFSQIGALPVVVFQALWGLFVLLISKIKRLGD